MTNLVVPTQFPLPALYVDFANNFNYYNGALYPDIASWLTAIGGTAAGTLTVSSQGILFDGTNTITISPISSWYNSNGTLYALADTSTPAPAGGQGIAAIYNSGPPSYFDLRLGTSDILAISVVNGSITGNVLATDSGQSAYQANVAAGAAMAISSNTLTYVKNGGTVDVVSLTAQPDSLNTLSIGANLNGAINGHISRVGYWSSPLTAAQLQSLTSLSNIITFDLFPTTLTRAAGKYFSRRDHEEWLARIAEENEESRIEYETFVRGAEAERGLSDNARAERDLRLAEAKCDSCERAFETNPTKANHDHLVDAETHRDNLTDQLEDLRFTQDFEKGKTDPKIAKQLALLHKELIKAARIPDQRRVDELHTAIYRLKLH